MTTHSLMISHQQSMSDAWVLAPGQVRSFVTGPGERLLHVNEGRVWLTVPGDVEEPAEDVWLEAGDSVRLRQGSQLVVEGWTSASFQLLVPPSACAQASR